MTYSRPPMSLWFGIVMGLAASASWAAANVFVQRSSRAVGPFRALVWAQVVGGAALAPLAALWDQRAVPPTAATVGWAVAIGMAAVLAYACLFFSMERGQLSIVVPVMAAWSVIAAALGIVGFGESLRREHFLGSALVVVGVLVVGRFASVAGAAESDSAPGFAVTQQGRRGALVAAVGAAVGFGLLIPGIDWLAPFAGRLGAIVLVFALDLVIGVPIALAAGVNLRPPARRDWPAVAAAGLFETMGFVWISLGTSRAPVAVVAPLAGLASAFTVVFAWLVLRERPAKAVLVGAAIACAGVVTLSL